MASIYEELDLDPKAVEAEAGAQTLGAELPEPGVYDAEIKQIYIRKTDSGAKMLCLDMNLKDVGPLFWETCIAAGDAKNNKPTFGMTKTMPHIFQALGTTNPAAAKGNVTHKGEVINAMAIPELAGRKMVIGLRHEENEWQGSVNLKPLLETFLKSDGTNAKGEPLRAKLEEKIEKSPLKALKKTAVAAAPAAGAVAAAATDGW